MRNSIKVASTNGNPEINKTFLVSDYVTVEAAILAATNYIASQGGFDYCTMI